MRFLIVPILLLYTIHSQAQDSSQEINLEDSVIEWKAYKVVGKHNGTINLSSGTLWFDEEDVLFDGKFVVDVTSLQVKDLVNEDKSKLERHIKSADFFDVKNYHEAYLDFSKVTKLSEEDYKIEARLTIKDVTAPIHFRAVIKEGVGKANFSVDRSIYNITYRSGSFFDNLGDLLIYDLFDLSIRLSY